MTEYEREFVYLNDLNDEIRMMIRGNEILEFFILFDRAQKMEEVYNNKMQRDRRVQEFNKRGSSMSFSLPPTKKSKEDLSRATSTSEHLNKNKSI
ncbi:Hexaprenyldihydroxybenzoate methyltransferase, mitochondrial-like protein [Gossypium australe]|uniref:Hexaprenyldihydroxybenzoate methyltransferase, mitochondrial-like protein n=1 Tax=Gossypium australe TaxID=47621 RepID=A0A5B6VM94_9ROSI|nr:Hexaprenyldihydroxybenzoate methyltransferase, mitochondrial-like protein [Gossypium australe]